jgi:chorismate dehydratase
VIRVLAISYLNSIPFIYGLKQSKLFKSIDLSVTYPSKIAEDVIHNKVDIALVPVVILKQLNNYKIITDFCIGTESSVDSVCLYSHVPINQVTTISLDYQSRTSVELLKLLLRDYWKVNPKLNLSDAKDNFEINDSNAALVIGDRSFALNQKYPYVYDLAKEWNIMTGLPFVFACWICVKKLKKQFLLEFNDALRFGVSNISKALQSESYHNSHINHEEYLSNKISYNFDLQKKKAMKVFLERIKT